MRYRKGHKEGTKKRITDIAARRFRKEGIHAVGIAGLMSDAGLTHGGFYSHFRSKEDLAIKALSHALQETLARLESCARENNGGLEALVSTYLHPFHREEPENGCAIAAIGPELSRRPEESQTVISDLINQFFNLVERHLPRSAPQRKRKQTAVGLFGLMVGTLQLSRMMGNEKQKDEVLKSGIAAALELAQTLSGVDGCHD